MFGTYSNVAAAAPVSLQSMSYGGGMTTMAAPMQTYGAPMTMGAPIQTIQAPMTTMMAQPAVEYITQAPQMIEYAQPAMLMSQPAVEIDRVNAYGQVVERDFIQQTVAPRNLLAMGNVVSERVISIEELASMDRYAAAEAVMVQVPREIMVQQPQMVEYVQQPMVEYVQAQPAVEYIQAPQTVEYIQPQITTMQPQMMTMAQPQMMTTMAAPQMTTMQPQMMTMAAPQMTLGSQMAYGAPQMGIQSVI
jgi:hypothetical protein